jgi:hypothetical protein
LEELPLPCRLDMQAYDTIGYARLREHIARVGVTLYRRGNDGLTNEAGEPAS